MVNWGWLVNGGWWIEDRGSGIGDGGETVRPGLTAHAKHIPGDIGILPCYFFSPDGDFYVKK
jgi:hypothetical protein